MEDRSFKKEGRNVWARAKGPHSFVHGPVILVVCQNTQYTLAIIQENHSSKVDWHKLSHNVGWGVWGCRGWGAMGKGTWLRGWRTANIARESGENRGREPQNGKAQDWSILWRSAFFLPVNPNSRYLPCVCEVGPQLSSFAHAKLLLQGQGLSNRWALRGRQEEEEVLNPPRDDRPSQHRKHANDSHGKMEGWSGCEGLLSLMERDKEFLVQKRERKSTLNAMFVLSSPTQIIIGCRPLPQSNPSCTR